MSRAKSQRAKDAKNTEDRVTEDDRSTRNGILNGIVRGERAILEKCTCSQSEAKRRLKKRFG